MDLPSKQICSTNGLLADYIRPYLKIPRALLVQVSMHATLAPLPPTADYLTSWGYHHSIRPRRPLPVVPSLRQLQRNRVPRGVSCLGLRRTLHRRILPQWSPAPTRTPPRYRPTVAPTVHPCQRWSLLFLPLSLEAAAAPAAAGARSSPWTFLLPDSPRAARSSRRPREQGSPSFQT